MVNMKLISIILSLVGMLSFSSEINNSTKMQKVENMMKRVMNTDRQMMPKLCRYILITGVENEELEKAKNVINLGILANSLTTDLYVLIDNNQEAKNEIKEFVKGFGVKYLEYNSEKDALEKIKGIRKDGKQIEDGRILVITDSKNMRVYLAKMINEIDNLDYTINDFAYLYNTTRLEYENLSQQEKELIYNQIK